MKFATVCSRCRRLKVRCDVGTKPNNTCSRCENACAQCIVEKQEKLTKTQAREQIKRLHQRIDQLTKELEIATAKQNLTQSNRIPSSNELLSDETAQELITFFISNLSRCFPILSSTAASVQVLKTRSPLLMYSMCSIAARYLPSSVSSSELFEYATHLIRTMLSPSSEAADILDIHGMMILAAWPPLPSFDGGLNERRARWTWILSGHAIRSAQSIGLFEEVPRTMNILEKTERHRTMLGLFLLDRCFSLSLNKPLALYPNTHLMQARNELDNSPFAATSDKLLIHNSDLQRINGTIKEQLSMTMSPEYTAIQLKSFNTDLDAWIDCLRRLDIPEGQFKMLSFHYYHSKVVLNARAFEFYKTHEIFHSLAVTCVASALSSLEGFNDTQVTSMYRYNHDLSYIIVAFPALLLIEVQKSSTFKGLLYNRDIKSLITNVANVFRNASQVDGDVPDILGRLLLMRLNSNEIVAKMELEPCNNIYAQKLIESKSMTVNHSDLASTINNDESLLKSTLECRPIHLPSPISDFSFDLHIIPEENLWYDQSFMSLLDEHVPLS